MKVTFITPVIGRKLDEKYVRTWQMESLTIATLAGLTPDDVEIDYFDERMEEIDYDSQTDLVAISTETYTAKRSYEISAEFHKRGVPVILGGYHPTLMPDEAGKYADSVLVGFAENLWCKILEDCNKGRLKKRYIQRRDESLQFKLPRRDIFNNRDYLKLHCVETVRGCPFDCDFCAIAAFSRRHVQPKPLDLIMADLQQLQYKTVFFVDDNIFGNVARAEELFKKITPLKLNWVSQGSINLTKNLKMLKLMAESGCIGLLVGFESFNRQTLKRMNKMSNLVYDGDYDEAVRIFSSYGIGLYATFVMGYETESLEDIDKTVEKSIELGIFMAAFNHLVPFPATTLYKRLLKQGLVDKEWWLDPEFKYGMVPFKTSNYSAEQLSQACVDARRKFFSLKNTLIRAKNYKGNLNTWKKVFWYGYINYLLGKEVDGKYGLPLGDLRV